MIKFKRIYVEITNICNLHCTFCPATKRKPLAMSPDDFLHIIKEIKLYTDYVYLHVKGEPLLHSNLNELLSICSEYHLLVNITTNGTLLDHAWDSLRHASCLRQLNISLHSFGANERVNFKEYIANAVHKAKYLSLHTNTITSFRLWNLEGCHSEIDYERNIDVLEFLKNEFPKADSFDSVLLKKSGIPLDKHIYLHTDMEFQWPDLENEYYNEAGYCYGLKSQLGILSDGTVIPCCLDGEGTVNLGNLFSQSLQDILDSDRAVGIRTGFSRRKAVEELCRHCSFKDRF